MRSTVYALLSPDSEIVEYRSDVDPEITTKAGWKWVPVIDSEYPKFNQELQYTVGPKFSILDDTVVKYWDVLDKTQDQLQSEKIQKVLSIDQNTLKIFLYYENRLRLAEGQTPIDLEQLVLQLKDQF